MSDPQTHTGDSFHDAEEQVIYQEEPGAPQDSSIEEPQQGNLSGTEESITSSPSKSKKKKNKKRKGKNSISSTEPDLNNEEQLEEQQNVEPPVEEANLSEEVKEQLEDEQEADQLETEVSADEDVKLNVPQEGDLKQSESPLIPETESQTEPEQVASEETHDSKILSSTLEDPISESTQSMDIVSELSRESKVLDDQIDELNHNLNDYPTEEEEENPFFSPAPARTTEATNEEPKSPKGNNPFIPPELPSRDIKASAPAPPLPTKETSSSTVSPAVPERDVLSSPPTLPHRDILTNGTTSELSSESPAPPPLPVRKPSFSEIKKEVDPTSFLPPPLPPQLTATQKQQHRPSVFQGWFQRSSVSASKESLSDKSIEYEENYDLLLNRLSENSEDLRNIDDVSRDQLNTSHMELRSTFAERVSEIEKSESSNRSTSFGESDNTELHEIDWPFWTQVVNDYPSVVKTEPIKLSKQLSGGIPSQVRGIVWQLVSNSNTKEFASIYEDLQTKESKFEKNIIKDLSRTSFMSAYNIDQEAVYRIIKAYSILDTEVGYTQGMAFITVPLLMNLSELESFALLHKLMYGYNIRSLYLPDMPGLLLKLYQFDRLLEDNLPKLHTHFKRQGVQSSMFASQWFLTFFAYKFPLEFVLRIFDIVIAEGFESLLKFAIALVQKNEAKLLTLRFDDLIDFLKDQLFNSYLTTPVSEEDEDEIANSTGLDNIFKKKKAMTPITVDSYDVDSLVHDAMNVKIPPITLRRYEEEFSEIHRVEKERREEIEETKLRNNQLRREVRKMEASYTLLNREHVQIANEMINGRVKIATLEDENQELRQHNNNLKERVKALQNPPADQIPVPVDLEEDLKKTMQRNLEVMSKNQELEDQMLALMEEVDRLRAENEALIAASKVEVDQQQPEHRAIKGWAPKIFGKRDT